MSDYMAELLRQNPDLWVEHTGGGCTALVRTTNDGGWLVITDQGTQAPATPDEPGCVVVKYAPTIEGRKAEYWGDHTDDEHWCLVHTGRAGDCVAVMLYWDAQAEAGVHYGGKYSEGIARLIAP